MLPESQPFDTPFPNPKPQIFTVAGEAPAVAALLPDWNPLRKRD